MKPSSLLLGLIGLCATPGIGAAQIEKLLEGAKIDLRVNKKYASNMPISFECGVENQSKKSWCIEEPHSPFVNGMWFRAELINEEGQKRNALVTNGIGLNRSSVVGASMEPGERRTVPLAIGPLSPGNYVLVVQRKHRANIEVLDDAKLREATLRRYVDGFWAGDFFCSHMLRKLSEGSESREAFRAVEDEMLQAMHSDDDKKAVVAHRFFLMTLPSCRPDLVEKHLIESVAQHGKEAEFKSADLNARKAAERWYSYLGSSSHVAGQLGTDKSLAVVLDLANSSRFVLDAGQIRWAAVRNLAFFKQEKAADALVKFATRTSKEGGGEEHITYEAAHSLCVRKDPRALGILFKLFDDNEFRAYKGKILFSATALYDNPGVDEFIKAATTNPDPGVRGDAQGALRRLSEMRENYQKK